MWILPSSSEHNSLLSHSKECHERKTTCFVSFSHSVVVMVESTSDSTMKEKRSKVKWDATEGSNG